MNMDIESVFRKATDGNRIVPDDWMPTSKVRPFILDDPGQVWLEFHGELHGLRPDSPGPYSFFDFIAQKAEQFKAKWIKEEAGGAKPICEESYHVRYADKFRQTLNLMADEVPVIVDPALWWAPARVYGVPDLLVHTSWLEKSFPTVLDDVRSHMEAGEQADGYVIFEIRLGSKERGEQEAVESRIRLNTYMLGHIQDWMPPGSFLFTRDAVGHPKWVEIASVLGESLDKDLLDIRDHYVEIRRHGGNMIPWRDGRVILDLDEMSEQWKTAKLMVTWGKTPRGDPRALYCIGAKQKVKLAELGLDCIDSLLKVDPTEIPFERDVPGIGKARAKMIRSILQANRTGLPVLPDEQATPVEREFEFYVDFEYFNNLNVDFEKEWPSLRGREMLFMIGVGWEEQGEWKFEVFVAQKEKVEQERKMIEAFLEFLEAKTDGAFTNANRTALYHWTNAEVSQSRRAAQRLDVPQDHPFRDLGSWVDLQREFMQTPCAVPGAWDFGLKAVAKALGKLDADYDPRWAGDLDDGLGAMVLGWKAYEKRKPTSCDEMKILRQYLEADCKALWCILRWMRDGDLGVPFDAPGQSYVGWDKVRKRFSKPADEDEFVVFNKGKGVFVYLQPNLGDGKWSGIKKTEHLIWGDSVRVLESQGDWLKICSRGTVGWIHKRFIHPKRLLEVNFVDVGQGDGCFIVTPDDEYILIDAGQEDHMYRFLRWRFAHFRRPLTFDAAIITHPDKDHYYGFRQFFERKDEAVQSVRFRHLYHNGIIERTSGELGASATVDDVRYLTEIITDRASLKQILDAVKGGGFLTTLKRADQCGRVDDISMLSAGKSEPKYMLGYEEDKEVSIEVLSPVPETPLGELHLRWFKNDPGMTKNGHSIVLRLKYGNVSLLLGGDLNVTAEQHLLAHYGGICKPFDELNEHEKQAMVEKARELFGSDIAKSCHHGSADVSAEFLQAVNAVATVVSSGDNESHCHPRPESLGVLGKHGRGPRPLIFSTELARSAKEIIRHPGLVRMDLEDARSKDKEIEFIDQLLQDLGRSVAVYGMITLRTDGQNVVIAQKLEKARPNGQKWDLTLLSPGEDGRLCYQSKHGD